MARVLALDLNGFQQDGFFEEAITYQAKEMVGWSIGDIIAIFKGGYNRLTVQGQNFPQKHNCN